MTDSSTPTAAPLSVHVPLAQAGSAARLPVGLGLAMGAVASLTLWAGLVAGVRALLT